MTDQETTEPEYDAEYEDTAPEEAPAAAPHPEATRAALPAEAPPMDPHYPPPVPQARSRNPQARNPWLAAIFSMFPGVGNVYNGLYLRGAAIFLIFIGAIALAHDTRPPEAVLLVFAIIFIWLFNIFDAYRQATYINFGYRPDAGWQEKPKVSNWGSGGLAAGVAVFLLGLYGLLRDRFDIDFTVLVDWWYVWFMAFGLFLIYQWWRRLKGSKDEAEEY